MFNTPSPGGASTPPPVVPASTLSLVARASDEGEYSTTSATFVQGLALNLNAGPLGVQYIFNFYAEIFAPADEDVEVQCTVNGTEVCFGHFKNGPYSDRWAQMNGAFFWDDEQAGVVPVAINYRNGYGANPKKIQRMRILIYKVNT